MTSHSKHYVSKALIVEDNAPLRESFALAVSTLLTGEVRAVGSVGEVKHLLAAGYQPELVVLDVELGDGSAFDVLLQLDHFSLAPAVVGVSGVAGPEDAFRLAQLGLRAYVPKPADLTSLSNAIDQALRGAPDLVPHVRASVGKQSLHAVEDIVRSTMLEQALLHARGNRRAAARLLHVSRQLLQHMLRKSPSDCAARLSELNVRDAAGSD